MLLLAIEAAVLALSLSVDAFAVSFAYGCKKIQIPPLSAYIINGICTSITGLSFLVGRMLEPFINSGFAVGISFVILLLIGISKLHSKNESTDSPKCISYKGAIILATSLSLDGFAVGFGAALLGFNGWAIVLFSLLANGLALKLGTYFGNTAALRLPFNVSWFSGLILITLAMTRLF